VIEKKLLSPSSPTAHFIGPPPIVTSDARLGGWCDRVNISGFESRQMK
jgi:hypothetical protein